MNTLKIISEADWKLKHNEITLGEYMDMVEPLSEVVPVKHGHWIENDNGTYSCSECYSWIPNEQHFYANYCIYCGAKMDGGKDNE